MPHPVPPAAPVSLEDLYAEHGPRVLRLLTRLGVADADREDVAQEVWTVAHRSLSSFDPNRGTTRAWLSGIVRNTARSHRRKLLRRPEDAALPDHEPPHLHVEGSDERFQQARQRAALWLFVEHAIPNDDQREAFVLHEIEGLTVEEVATATGTGTWTAQWRIRMARNKLRAAEQKLSDDEREKLRAVVLPLGGFDGLLRALRDTPVSDDEVARVWDRVVDRIHADGGSIHDRLGDPRVPSFRPPQGYTLTAPRLASFATAVFLLGALTGAVAHALLTSPVRAKSAPIEAEIAPLPSPSLGPRPEPSPSASVTTAAAPNATIAPNATSAPTATIASLAPAATSSPTAKIASNAPPASPPYDTERSLMERARTALMRGASQLALDQANKHARLFPRSNVAAVREEIAVRALVQLGQRDDAAARAERLLLWAPQMRSAMAAALGGSFF
ncbi:MAG: sigma-70 family RNA polymerase sigma factor [Polyangiaceae bacterium]